jgi:ATP-dependent exoDNAse (exonuclease V) beta subunit
MAKSTAQMIRASAGSGKTYQLAGRFVGLLLQGAKPDEILATTFTRKAAGEILERVLLRLAQASTNEAERKQLAAFTGGKTPTSAQLRQLLLQTVRAIHRMRVGTLDSFFAQLATSYGLELGLPPGWAIGDPLEDGALCDEAVQAVLSAERAGDLLTLLHLLTKGEARRSIHQLVLDTVATHHELYRQTNSEAWRKIARHQEPAPEEVERAIAKLEATTWTSDKNIVKRHADDVANARQGAWEDFLDNTLIQSVIAGECTYRKKELPPDIVAAYKTLIDRSLAHCLNQIASQTEAAAKLLEHFDLALTELRHQRRSLSFSDVTYALTKLSLLPDAERLAFRLDGGVAHLLLDEFQDTSLPQWQVLKPFARQVAKLKDRGSFFCVGDTKQAIYGWRGGVSEIFDAVGQEVPKCCEESLSTSWRSSPAVIELVNRVFTGIKKHDNLDRAEEGVTAWCKQFELHRTERSSLPGYACLQTCPEIPKEEGDRVAKEEATDTVLQYTAELIQRQLENAPGRTIGVLVRQNDTVARMIYLLRQRGVPASEEGGNPLTDSAPVEAVLSLLRLADHPGDTTSRFHVASSPLGKIVHFERFQSDERAEKLAGEIRRKLLEEGYGPTIFAWARELAPLCDARDQSRLQQLVEFAYQYQPSSTLRPTDFIQLVEQERIFEPTTDLVRVMTVHQSKGLEFDTVFLPELNVRFPGQEPSFVARRPAPGEPVDLVCRYVGSKVRAMLPREIQEVFEAHTRQQVMESLCVLYVALTRAVHALHLVVPPTTEKSLPKSYVGLLRAALVDGAPLAANTIYAEIGDAEWWRKASCDAPDCTPCEELPAQIVLAPPPTTRERGLDRVRPSGLEGGAKLRLKELFQNRHTYGAQRGTLIHAWFEQIQWLEQGAPSEAKLREVAKNLAAEIGDVSGQIEPLLASFHKALAQPDLAAALSKSCYEKHAGAELRVENERPFAVALDGGELLSGSIDRLVTIWRGNKVVAADILDFKTDEIPLRSPEKLKDKIAYYRPQIDAYRRAVASWTGLPPSKITARLIFTGIGHVAPVEPAR